LTRILFPSDLNINLQKLNWLTLTRNIHINK